jgi:pimeloyl-ACP methyl ester carboxylesterase
MLVDTVVKSVALSTGVTLEFVERGDPAGQPVILLHGVTDSWRSYENLMTLLPSRLRVFALSQRGHGNSERPESGYLMRDFAADVAAFMDAVGIERAVVAGMSMGSSVAQRFAADYPERVTKLILIASFYSFDKPELTEFTEQGILPLVDPIDRSFALEFQQSTLAQPIDPEQLEVFVDESMKVPAYVWRAVFSGFSENTPPLRPNEVTAPTLILWGDQDLYGPREDQEMLRSVIPGSRLNVYEGHGHALHWEAPRRVADDIVAFIDEKR